MKNKLNMSIEDLAAHHAERSKIDDLLRDISDKYIFCLCTHYTLPTISGFKHGAHNEYVLFSIGNGQISMREKHENINEAEAAEMLAILQEAFGGEQ